ncbi:MAG: penicillin acylase family protein [Acidobacteriota bacterium]
MTGLSAPVRIVRDTWGVPHIYAETQADLFFAQGFVQAQDRLFQMDLWRRSAQGRLSEVLGANFIERDAMTRRIQYRGDMRAEWDSYGADTESIATAFAQGINAWVDIASRQLPEEFALAGWRPEHWRPEDLLNRTDAFVTSANAAEEVFHARLVAAVGPRRAEALLQGAAPLRFTVADGLDVRAITYVVGDALRGVGAPPVFSGLAAPVAMVRLPSDFVPESRAVAAQPTNSHEMWPGSDMVSGRRSIASASAGADGHPDGVGSNAWAVSGSRSATGAPLIAADPHAPLDHPSSRYLVHLIAPGWNVIGAATPWLPGVVIGHNEHVAWATTARADDVQDLYAERVNPANPHQVERAGRWVDTTVVADPIAVKRREKPFSFDRETTPHGVIIASDRSRHLAFTIRWAGFEPGTAAGLGALAIDRAASAEEFLGALKRWKLPTATFVYATRAGVVGTKAAGLVPIRRAWNGALPAPGWTGRHEWQGLSSPEAKPGGRERARDGYVASANDSVARTRRIDAVMSTPRPLSIDDFKALQHDTMSWNADQLVPLLAPLRSDRADVDAARVRLMAWDRRIAADSIEATLYVLWERSLLRRLAQARLDSSLVDEFLARETALLVPIVTNPSSVWFDGNPSRSRDAVMLSALADAVDAAQARQVDRVPVWGALHTALFRHPLAVGPAARARFDIGPFERGGYAETVMATGGADFEQRTGASLRVIVDAGEWDRSVATNAPGQSGAPASRHFGDLARLWAAGEYFPLSFSERAVQDRAESTLTLTPQR